MLALTHFPTEVVLPESAMRFIEVSPLFELHFDLQAC
jgi:hypothetical protein